MCGRTYPFDLAFVQKLGTNLVPIPVPYMDDRYVLGIGLCSRCNFNCPICYYHGPEGKTAGRDMPLDVLAQILRPLPRLARIVIGLEGEPLLHKQFAGAMQIMASHSNELILITNGSLLNAEYGNLLLQFPMPYILISVDAADAVNYARFRHGGNFDLFMRNVESAVSIGHRAILHATVFKENLETLLGLPSLARTLGINRISLQQLRAHPGSLKRGVHPAMQKELEEWFAKLITEARFNKIQIMPDRFFGGPDFHAQLYAIAKEDQVLLVEKMCKNKCLHVETFAGIMSDGKLFPCAGDYAPAPMDKYSFDAIFNHPYLQILRVINRNAIKNPACTICTNCL